MKFVVIWVLKEDRDTEDGLAKFWWSSVPAFRKMASMVGWSLSALFELANCLM